jgi:hypothetical protein
MRGGGGRSTLLYSFVRFLIQPGVDNGGKRGGVTLVGLSGKKCQAGEGGGGGDAPQGQRKQQHRLQGKGGERRRGGGGHGGKKGKRFVEWSSS